MLKYAFYLKLFVLIKHLSAGGEWADLELKMGILFSQIYLTKKCIVAAMYDFEMKCHSVLFSILGLPLFGEKILRQAAASCFQLNMLYFCVLYDNIEKKNPRKS